MKKDTIKPSGFGFPLSIGMAFALIYIEDYFSFLLCGIIYSILVATRLVSEATGESIRSEIPKEKLRQIFEMSRDRENFMSTIVITGLVIGTVMYFIKLFLVLLF